MNERRPANDESGNVPWLEPVPRDAIRESGTMLTPQVIKIGAALLALIIFAGLLWYLYARSAEVSDPLLVRAPTDPIKEEPADRGGLDVPHQDKLVLDPDAEASPAQDTLLPGPEEPMDKPEPELIESEPVATPPALPGEEPIETPTAEAEASDPDPEPEVAPQSAPEQSAPEPVAASSTQPAAKSGAYLAQLGAFSTESNARSDWQRIQKAFPAAVSGLVSDIEPANRGGRTLYLLRAGPLADRPAVDSFCNTLKAKGQGCFAVAN